MWLVNLFLLERTEKQELQKWKQGPREFDYHALLHHQAVLYILFPSISSSSSSFLFFSSPSSYFLPNFMRFGRPSLLSCRDLQERHTGVQARPPPPPGSKIMTG